MFETNWTNLFNLLNKLKLKQIHVFPLNLFCLEETSLSRDVKENFQSIDSFISTKTKQKFCCIKSSLLQTITFKSEWNSVKLCRRKEEERRGSVCSITLSLKRTWRYIALKKIQVLLLDKSIFFVKSFPAFAVYYFLWDIKSIKITIGYVLP